MEYRTDKDEKKQEGNRGFSGLESILLCDLAKGSLMDLFSSPVVKFSLTQIGMEVDY